MTISNKTLTQALVTIPNHLNQITRISMTTKLPTEKRFYITTKFEKYAVYSYMARDEHHALELHEDGSYDNYEEEWGEYNEKIEEIEEEEVFDQVQLSLAGVL